MPEPLNLASTPPTTLEALAADADEDVRTAATKKLIAERDTLAAREEAVASGEVEKVWTSVVEYEKVVSEQRRPVSDPHPLRFIVDGKHYVLGPCVGDTTYPRRNVGDLVAFYSHEWKAAKVVDRKNPRMCRNGWDFYLEGEGGRAFSRNDLYFLDPFVEAE